VRRYRQFGEIRGIGATSHVLDIEDKRIVVDWGVEFERNASGSNTSLPPSGNWLVGEKVDAIIVSHAHMDHIGAMPRLAAKHPEATIYISAQALAAGEILLNDSLKIARQETRAARDAGHEPPIEIFNAWELNAFLHSPALEVVDSPTWFEPWEGWKIGFHPAGHDTGAMMTLIVPPQEGPVIITGDISSHDQEIVPGVMLPDRAFSEDFLDLPGLVLITESTNGNRKSPGPRSEIKKELIRVSRIVEARGGVILCAAFAKNRSGNLTLIFVEAGIVPHIDGLARILVPTEIPYLQQLIDEKKVALFGRGKSEIEREATDQHRKMVDRGEDAVCNLKFSPIISPSADLEKGFGVKHAQRILEDPRNAVFFAGHIFEGTVAEQILNIKRGRTVKLGDQIVNVRCDVFHFDLSGHDYQEALVERVRLAHPETVILHHGSLEACDALTGAIKTLPDAPRVERGEYLSDIEL